MQNHLALDFIEFLRLRHALAPLQSENDQGNFLAAPLAKNFDAMGDSGFIHIQGVGIKAVQ